MPASMKDPNIQKALAFLDQCLAGQKDFTQANLEGIILYRAILGALTLDGANLTQAKLDNVVLRQASLIGAQLDQAQLKKASLIESDFSNASMQSSQLQGADLSQAILREADLQNADLSEAQLTGADVQGANLRGTNLLGTNLKGATYSDTTQFDQLLDPQKAGMVNIKDLESPESNPLPATEQPSDGVAYLYYRGTKTKRQTSTPSSGTPAAPAQASSPEVKKEVRRYRGAIIAD